MTTHVLYGNPAEAIAQLALDIEADLVIVGTHGHRAFARLLLGSVAEGVVRLAPCPVLVVRAKETDDSAKGPRIEPPCLQFWHFSTDQGYIRQQKAALNLW